MAVELNELLAKQRWPILIALGTVLMVVVGVGDYFASSALLEFSVFFLIPVWFFTWYITRAAGIFASVSSAAIAMVANIASPAHVVHPRVAYWNALVWLGFFVLLTLIVAELQKLYHVERKLSRVDNLTRISNRLAFYEIATAEKNRAQRFGQPVTLAYLDLDGFKQVNDSWGHAVGDRVLISVARTMQNVLRQTDAVARMGGDEFAFIMPNTGKDAAGLVLNKLSAKLAHTMRQNRWPVTFSVGAATFMTPPDSVQEMITRADELMYLAKTNGRGSVQQEESQPKRVAIAILINRYSRREHQPPTLVWPLR
jgi:diguanylate cyclase (GGDEF)-like protein